MREYLVLVHDVVQQPVDLRHAMSHERGDAGGRDAAETLQRRWKPEEVVGGGEEEEEEEKEGDECEQRASLAAGEAPCSR